MLVTGHGGTAALLCGVPAVTDHGEARQSTLQNRGDHATMSRRLRRLEALRRSTAMAAAMAELRQRHTHGGATRMAAYLRHDYERCKVETVEKGEAELRAWSIGEWGGGERGRARQSSYDGNGDGGCYGGCAEAKESENEMEEGRRTLLGRWRRARGGRGRPGLPRGVRRWRMAATRRARPDAIGRGAREQARRSAEAGQARELG